MNTAVVRVRGMESLDREMLSLERTLGRIVSVDGWRFR